MRNYTTQMDAARKGIVTPEIETVAKKENMDVDKLMKLVAEGKVAICANKNHKCLDPQGVGSMLKTKINVNLGVSKDCKDYDIEKKKVFQPIRVLSTYNRAFSGWYLQQFPIHWQVYFFFVKYHLYLPLYYLCRIMYTMRCKRMLEVTK